MRESGGWTALCFNPEDAPSFRVLCERVGFFIAQIEAKKTCEQRPWNPTLAKAQGWGTRLIVLGVARDLLVDRRVHKVYLYALPLLIVGQSLATYMWRGNPAWW